MSHKCILSLWLNWIWFKMKSEWDQGSFILKLYLQTDSIYSCTIYEMKISWGKTTQQAADTFNSEKMWDNGIRVVVIVRNFTHPILTLSLIKKTSFSFCCVFTNNAQFVRNIWMYVKFVDWKFTSYTVMITPLIFVK